MENSKNTLVLLENWKEHYIKKNIGINIQLHTNKTYVYCNEVISSSEGLNFIESRISKHKTGVYFSFLRYIRTIFVLFKYRINKVNWGYISDDEMFIICIFKLVFRRTLKIYVKTDSEDITKNRSFVIKKYFLENIDKIFVESNAMAELYKKVFTRPEIVTLFNPSIFEYHGFSRKIDPTSSERLLFVGRISPEKNIHGLLKIFEVYAKTKKSRCLSLMMLPENKDYWYELELEINRLKAAEYNIRVIMEPSLELMHQEYIDSDILCITSSVEGVPNILSDAFYMGLPVISYRVGNIPFILNDSCLLCNNEKEFVEKLEKLSNPENYRKAKDDFYDFYNQNMSFSVFKNKLSI